MEAYVVQNPVPTPEEMAEILGVSAERLAAVRRIMNSPVPRKSSNSSRRKPASKLSAYRKKSVRVQKD